MDKQTEPDTKPQRPSSVEVMIECAVVTTAITDNTTSMSLNLEVTVHAQAHKHAPITGHFKVKNIS